MKRHDRKRIIVLFAFLVTTTLLSAQVGINTENPLGVFYIDGKGDTSGSANIADDIIVSSDGNIGVGTNSPTTKLDIRTSTKGGGFALQDGTQGEGKVLLSNIKGNASWGNLAPKAMHGIINSGNIAVPSAPTYRYLGMYINVPPGKSQVYAGGMVTGANTLGYITTTLSTSIHRLETNGIGWNPGLAGFGVHTGTTVGQVVFFVENVTSAPITVYLFGTLGGGMSSGIWVLTGVGEPFIFVAY